MLKGVAFVYVCVGLFVCLFVCRGGVVLRHLEGIKNHHYAFYFITLPIYPLKNKSLTQFWVTRCNFPQA